MPPHSSARRVLIYRLGSLGDTVVALPCFHLIAAAFPNAERRLLTNIPVDANAPAAATVLKGSGLVHGYMHYRAATRNPLELLRLAAHIRRFRPDLLVYLMPHRLDAALRRDQWFFRSAGVRRVIGLAPQAAMNSRFDPASGLYESEAACLARMLHQLGDARIDDAASWSLNLSMDEHRVAQAALGPLASRPLLVVAPGTRMQAKDWGRDNWRALLAKIAAAYPGFGLALVGSKYDFAVADDVSQGWSGPKANLGGLTPRQMAAAFTHATAFLGADSGPMHLAAAAGVPCVIAFSASQLPGIWFPHGDNNQVVYHRTPCAGCRLETCTVEAKRCLTSISVDEMLAAFVRAMGVRRTSQRPLAIY